MKKRIFGIILLFVICFAYASEENFYSGFCFTPNKKLQCILIAPYAVHYDTVEEKFYLIFPYQEKRHVLAFDNNQIEKFKKVIEKYFEWNELALAKEATLDKAIPQTNIVLKYGAIGEDKSYTVSDFEIYFSFFSQNTQRHQLVLRSHKATSDQNPFVKCTMPDIYFDYYQIKDLYDQFSEENLRTKMESYKRSEEMDSLFQ